MFLQDNLERNFLLVTAEDPVERVLSWIKDLDPDHILVRQPPDEAGYIHARTAWLTHELGSAPPNVPLGETQPFRQMKALPAIPGLLHADLAPDACVAVDGDVPIGVFIVPEEPQFRSVFRGGKLNHGYRGLVPSYMVLPEVKMVEDASYFDVCVPIQVMVGQEFQLEVTWHSAIRNNGFQQDEEGEIFNLCLILSSGLSNINDDYFITVSSVNKKCKFNLKALRSGNHGITLLVGSDGQRLSGQFNHVIQASAASQRRIAFTESHTPIYLTSSSDQQPDVFFLIEETKDSDGSQNMNFSLFTCKPTLDNLFSKFTIPIERDSENYFKEFYKQIEKDKKSKMSEQDKESSFQLIGETLYAKLFPDDLRRWLSKHIDHINIIQILSNENWIPWEFCRIPLPGGDLPGKYLCEFSMSRWAPDLKQRLGLKMSRLGCLVQEKATLAYLDSEWNFLQSMQGVRIAPNSLIEVCHAFASGDYDMIHFAGHGQASDRDPSWMEIYLTDTLSLRPDVLAGRLSLCQEKNIALPTVFLNACDGARGGMSLTGLGGWASNFIRYGAPAFIGTNWRVDDGVAFDFCKAFYSHLRHGHPLGESVRYARLQAKKMGDPSWLAYTVYGDPMAKLLGAI